MFSVRANRAFLARTARFLTADMGIRQFVDIGTGIPTANNTHQVAQRVAPDCRIVYVDNDPIVLSHARALLTSSPEGACAYIDADMRDPEKILAEAADTLDFTKPVAVMLIAVLQFVGDDAEASGYREPADGRMRTRQFVTISHPASDIDAEQHTEMVRRLNQYVAEKATLRDRAGVARSFDGFELSNPEWCGPSSGGPTPSSKRPAPRFSGAASPVSLDHSRRERRGFPGLTPRGRCFTADRRGGDPARNAGFPRRNSDEGTTGATMIRRMPSRAPSPQVRVVVITAAVMTSMRRPRRWYAERCGTVLRRRESDVIEAKDMASQLIHAEGARTEFDGLGSVEVYCRKGSK